MKETVQKLFTRLDKLKNQFLYEFMTSENIHRFRGCCQQAVNEANQILNGHHIHAVLQFDQIKDHIYVDVTFINMITNKPVDPTK